jgi:hyperosmotically inducible protein
MRHRFDRVADRSLAMDPTRPPIPAAPLHTPEVQSLEAMRSAEFRARRSIWPRVMIAAVIAAGVSALLVSRYYDDRSLGAKLDDSVAAAGSKVQGGVEGLRDGAAAAAQGTANVAERAADAMGDAAITATVKTALAADPSLSAVKIDVTTKQGTVVLEGPAPDEKSRQRAAVLAAAPQGVARVDNNLVVPGSRAAPAPRAAPMPAASPPAPVEAAKASSPAETTPTPILAPPTTAQ